MNVRLSLSAVVKYITKHVMSGITVTRTFEVGGCFSDAKAHKFSFVKPYFQQCLLDLPFSIYRQLVNLVSEFIIHNGMCNTQWNV